jgi:predicted metalloprotease
MASALKGERAERERPARLWSVAAAAVIALGIAGTRASAAFLDIGGSPSAEPPSSARTPIQPVSAADVARLKEFVATVVQDVDALWARDFRRRSKPYTRAEPVLLGEPEKADCGPGIEFGRRDCFGTNQAFIDLSFLQGLQARYPENADGAKAYAIAHELGHHVQRVLGLDKKLAGLLAEKPVATHWAEVQLELQADCLAGVWSRRSQQQHLASAAQIEASIRQTSEFGTERRLTQRNDAESPGENFTYAIPRRRIYWFAQGYEHGELDDCDSFAP